MKVLQWIIPARKKQTYPVYIGYEAKQILKETIEKQAPIDTCVILYDSGMQAYAEKLLNSLHCKGIALASGEESKSLHQVARIAEDLVFKSATKNSVLICIGGGMTCDTGGFVASVFRRGMRHILVPTNLLAMTDAALGGKTAMNLGKMKNVLGTYHEPIAVIVDTNFLQTLPDAQLQAGLVEILKLAAMCDAEFFGWLEENIHRILDRDAKAIETCVQKSIQLKKQCEADEAFTKPQLTTAYFGHAIGHCLEALTNFKLSHAEAVSIGMCIEMNITKTKEAKRIVQLLQILHKPIHCPIEIRPKKLWDVLESQQPNGVHVCTPTSIGAHKCTTISFQNLAEAIDR